MTSFGIRLVNALMYHSMFSEKNKTSEYVIRTEKLKEMAGTKSSNNFIMQKLTDIANTRYTFNYLGLGARKNHVPDKWKGSFFRSVNFNIPGQINYKLSKKIEKDLRSPEFYTIINSSIVNKFRRLRTAALYEFILASHVKKNRSGKTKSISIQDLQRLIGMGENKYSVYDFQKYVIKPAIEEITEKTGMTIRYEKIRESRSISAFRFFSFEQSGGKNQIKNKQKVCGDSQGPINPKKADLTHPPEPNKTNELSPKNMDLVHPHKKPNNTLVSTEGIPKKKQNEDLGGIDLNRYPPGCKNIAGKIFQKDGKEILKQVLEYAEKRDPKNFGGYMRTVWKDKLYEQQEDGVMLCETQEQHDARLEKEKKENESMIITRKNEKTGEYEDIKISEKKFQAGIDKKKQEYEDMDMNDLGKLAEEKKMITGRPKPVLLYPTARKVYYRRLGKQMEAM